MNEIRQEDLTNLTFEVAEQIAQFILSEAQEWDHIEIVHDAFVRLTYKIRTNEWRENWERDPANETPEQAG